MVMLQISSSSNAVRMVMFHRWSLYCKENGHVMEVGSLQEAESLCYMKGSQFNGERFNMLERWQV